MQTTLFSGFIRIRFQDSPHKHTIFGSSKFRGSIASNKEYLKYIPYEKPFLNIAVLLRNLLDTNIQGVTKKEFDDLHIDKVFDFAWSEMSHHIVAIELINGI